MPLQTHNFQEIYLQIEGGEIDLTQMIQIPRLTSLRMTSTDIDMKQPTVFFPSSLRKVSISRTNITDNRDIDR
jgi:hypothetical protein